MRSMAWLQFTVARSPTGQAEITRPSVLGDEGLARGATTIRPSNRKGLARLIGRTDGADYAISGAPGNGYPGRAGSPLGSGESPRSPGVDVAPSRRSLRV